MTSKREQILERFLAILQEQALLLSPAVTTVVRNREELPPEDLPALYLCDGDEEREPVTVQPTVRRVPYQPYMMVMRPEIYAELDKRKPLNAKTGEDLNGYLVALQKAILFDSQLLTLVGSNGRIEYSRFMTDLARGRYMDGMMGITFEVIYPLIPSEL